MLTKNFKSQRRWLGCPNDSMLEKQPKLPAIALVWHALKWVRSLTILDNNLHQMSVMNKLLSRTE
jgi:hypothetical protein